MAQPIRQNQRRKNFLTGLGALLGLLILLSLAGACNDGPQETGVASDGPAPAATLGPREELTVALNKALGKSNRDVPRVADILIVNNGEFVSRINVRWAINESLTEGLTKYGAKKDALDILKVIQGAGYPQADVFLGGTMSLIDRYGKTSEDPVVKALYRADTRARIHFATMLTDNAYLIADEHWLHPVFAD